MAASDDALNEYVIYYFTYTLFRFLSQYELYLLGLYNLSIIDSTALLSLP